jgi:SulP family sulfate permease
MHAMEQLYDRCTDAGVHMVFSHVNEQPMKTMEKSGFVEKIGRDNFRPHIDDAIEWASKNYS